MPPSNPVAVLLTDPALAQQVGRWLFDEGLPVRVHSMPPSNAPPGDTQPPRALIVDAACLRRADGWRERVATWTHDQAVPLAVVGDAASVEDRRLAAQWSAVRFLGRPFDRPGLLQALSSLWRPAAAPASVLVVGPQEPAMLGRVRALASAGLDAALESDLDRLFTTLGSRPPDVVLLLSRLDGTSVPDLLAMLRADEAFDDVMALAVVKDAAEAKCLPAGASFVVEPVSPAELRLAVLDRARRRRRLSVAMVAGRQVLAAQEQERRALDAHALVSISDARGDIVYANDLFCQTSGYQRSELLGHSHRIVKSGRHSPEVYASMWHTILAGKSWRGELCNRGKGGNLYWVATTITPIMSASGERQYLSIRTDITAAKQVQYSLRQRVRQQQLLGALAARLMACDARRIIALMPSVLRLSARMIGAKGADSLLRSDDGRSLERLGHWCAPDAVSADRACNDIPLASVRRLWSLLAAGEIVNTADLAEMDPAARDEWDQIAGANRGSALLVPLRMAGGAQGLISYAAVPTGRGWARRDLAFVSALAGLISAAWARATAEQQVRRHEAVLARQVQRLEQMSRLADVGSWEVDAVTGTMTWSDQTYAIHEVAAGTPLTLEQALSFYEPQVREGVAATIEAAIKDAAPVAFDGRLITALGQVRWVRVVGVAHGRPPHVRRVTGAVQDITEQKAAEQALTDARDDAQRANQAKSEFLSTMSHELRTPMNAILGFGQLLEFELASESRHHAYVQEILKGGRHLLELIDDVLDLARIESGRVELSLERIALGELLSDCLRLLLPLAQRRGISMNAESMEGLTVTADRVRLRQVLVNLLSNAIKYNVDGGRVDIDARQVAPDRIRVQVRDTGCGIAPDRQAELFQPFNRLGAEGGPIEGTGIGLVIVRRLVEMMSGQVGLDSLPGQGSTFWFDLPLLADEAHAAGTGASDSLFAALPEVVDKRVLYIDDNPSNLRLVSQIMARWPAVGLLTAQHPLLGIELAEVHQPDLVLLDIQMTPLNGLEVIAEIRRRPALQGVPVIAITANAMSGNLERMRSAGFDDFLTKPFEVRRFIATVERHLQQRATVAPEAP